MPGYHAEPSRPDKAKAAIAVAGVYALVLGAALLLPGEVRQDDTRAEPTILIDIDRPPEPPPPPPAIDPARAKGPEGAAGKRANPAPVVAPEPVIAVPAVSPVATAPVPGSGRAPNSGMAASGSGPGAGGAGSGAGGGGSGSGGAATQAKLLGGNSSPLPSRLLRSFTADRGFALLWLTVAASGRVSDCAVLQSSGSAAVDQALCQLMERKSRWSPARDSQGQPVSVKLRYTATWRKN